MADCYVILCTVINYGFRFIIDKRHPKESGLVYETTLKPYMYITTSDLE